MQGFDLSAAMDKEFFTDWQSAWYVVAIDASNFASDREFGVVNHLPDRLVKYIHWMREIEKKWRFLHGSAAVTPFLRRALEPFRKYHSIAMRYLRSTEQGRSLQNIEREHYRLVERTISFGDWLNARIEEDPAMVNDRIRAIELV